MDDTSNDCPQFFMGDLNHAIHNRDTEAIQRVLLDNPDLLKNHDLRHFPLINALLLEDNNEEVVEFLIESGADVNRENPLKFALTENCSVKCIEILLKDGAELEGPQWDEKSVAQCVFDRELNMKTQIEILQLLFKYGLKVNFRNKEGKNLLHMFIEYINEDDEDLLEMVEFLLDSGVSVNEVDNKEQSALFMSILSDNLKLLSLLINRGADANAMCPPGGTSIIFRAVLYNNTNIVDLLSSNGAKVNAQNSLGWAPLHAACDECDEPMIKLLIEKGADISVKNQLGVTPFSMLSSNFESYDRCLVLMIKELSKLVFEGHSINVQDMNFIENNLVSKEHFENCLKELGLMKSRIFYFPYSHYLVLKKMKSSMQLAKLTKNEDFVQGFKKNLSYKYFKDDLQKIFEEAIKIRDESVLIESAVESIFGNCFPDVVIRKLCKCFTVKDLFIEECRKHQIKNDVLTT